MAQPTDPASELPTVWLVRHGETAWSRSGQHTSVTEMELTEAGADVARHLAPRLAEQHFGLVLTSPRVRARVTAELAGFPDAQVEEDLAEWFYGDYEGITTLQIRETVPGWTLWTHGVPNGETAEHVSTRLDRVVAKLRAYGTPGGPPALVFAHGHSLRCLAARWLGLPVTEGRLFTLDTATVSVLGYERETAVLRSWNDG